jgi:ribosome biogenesis protein MAK21
MSSPDLSLYLLTHFLDHFVYKNPKKAAARGASAMQPSMVEGASRVRRVRADVQETLLNIDGWWHHGEGAVPADQVYFQQYFAQKHAKEHMRAVKADKQKSKCDGSDMESDYKDRHASGVEEDSNANKDKIWKVVASEMPFGSD